jgi:hypothetical protein
MKKCVIVRLQATPEQEAYAAAYIQQGLIKNTHSFEQDEAKQRERQLVGMIAQIVIGDLLGIPRPTNTGSWDGGFDFVLHGKRWDVKGELRNGPFRPDFVHNVNAQQAQHPTNGYLFYSFNKKTLTIEVCGSITKEDFYQFATFHAEGTQRPRADGTSMPVRKGGVYEITQEYLKPFTSSTGWPVNEPTVEVTLQ